MIVYHTGYQVIRDPDIHFGRKHADFGQGFYTTKEQAFAKRWARERAGSDTYVNHYELDTAGLQIRRFTRDEAWFAYLFQNRPGKEDLYPQDDVIIGPIANDTLYDTLGIFSSGFLDDDLALHLLQAGPAYEQIVIKTDKARAQMHWITAEKIEPDKLAAYRNIVKEEEAAYQTAISQLLT